MDKHWTETFFIDHGDMLLLFLKNRDSHSPQQVVQLIQRFTELNVPSDATILDTCCGYGRHALRLAESGYLVTGVDLSPTMITHAKKLAKDMQVEDRVEFLVGDVRNISTLLQERIGTYDVILNLFTSLGYYDDETDCNILTQLVTMSSDKAVLVVELGNRDFIVKHFVRHGIIELNGYELHEDRALNYETSRMEATWKFYQRNGANLQHHTSFPVNHRLYSLHEFIRLLAQSGWSKIQAFSNLEGLLITSDSRAMYFICQKM
jgi:SAM-dependent methyltransferase